jgi:hypothetical protein
MSYTLSRFGTLYLPQPNPSLDIGTGESQSVLFPLAGGGAFDGLGQDQARQKPPVITYHCALTGDDQCEIQNQLDMIKGYIGTRAKLYRKLPDGTEQWITARLTNIEGKHSIEDGIFNQDIDLTFKASEYPWHGRVITGAGWTFDSGYNFDAGMYLDDMLSILMVAPGNITIVNNGNYPVRNLILILHTSSVWMGPITQFIIQKTGQTDLKWTGSVVAGNALVMDCGAFTVKNAGVDAYTGLTRQVGHYLPEWIRLDPGPNTFAINYTYGGQPSLTFAFDSGWA